MKKFKKKFLAVLVVAMLIVISCSTVVQAQPPLIMQSSRVLTLYSNTAKTCSSPLGKNISANIYIVGSVKKGEKVTGITVSNKSVATVGIKTGLGGSRDYKFIYAKVKKAGTAIVSYKVDGLSYKFKAIVKKYTSPLSTLKLNGTNIMSKFQKSSVCTLPYAKYAGKNVKLSFKARKGWTMEVAKQSPIIVKRNKTFRVTKKNNTLILDAMNRKTKQSETVVVRFK